MSKIDVTERVKKLKILRQSKQAPRLNQYGSLENALVARR
jgi:hypothetical protein